MGLITFDTYDLNMKCKLMQHLDDYVGNIIIIRKTILLNRTPSREHIQSRKKTNI